jgi:hypothetical protein
LLHPLDSPGLNTAELGQRVLRSALAHSEATKQSVEVLQRWTPRLAFVQGGIDHGHYGNSFVVPSNMAKAV